MGQLKIHTRGEGKLGEAVEERLTFTFLNIKTLNLSLSGLFREHWWEGEVLYWELALTLVEGNV